MTHEDRAFEQVGYSKSTKCFSSKCASICSPDRCGTITCLFQSSVQLSSPNSLTLSRLPSVPMPPAATTFMLRILTAHDRLDVRSCSPILASATVDNDRRATDRLPTFDMSPVLQLHGRVRQRGRPRVPAIGKARR